MSEVQFMSIVLEPSNEAFVEEHGYKGLIMALGEIATQQEELEGCRVFPYIKLGQYADFEPPYFGD